MIQKLYVCTKALTPWLFSARWQQTSKQASQAGIMGGMGMGKPCNHSTHPIITSGLAAWPQQPD